MSSPISWKTAPIASAPDPANAPQVIDAIRQAALWSQSGTAGRDRDQSHTEIKPL
jgi:hypothetical protein